MNHIKEEAVMMEGTEGKADYLMIATKGACAIGIKPVIDPIVAEGKECFVLGTRIRLAQKPGHVVLNVDHVAKTSFKDIPWQKSDSKRASVFVGAVVPPFPKDMTPDSLVQNLTDSGFFTKIVECLDLIRHNADDSISSAEIIQYIKDQFAFASTPYMKSQHIPTAFDLSNVVLFKKPGTETIH
jgi:hypothetical protein